MLTDKREKFVQNLNAGLSQRQAYREAYPKSRNWKDATVDKRASELFKNREVLGRYQELQKEKAEDQRQKNLWSYEQSVKGLMWIIQQSQLDIREKGLRQANGTVFINALKELNELQGLGEQREAKIELDRARIKKLKSEIDLELENSNKVVIIDDAD